jgi:anaerobic selenocysteine-containing dehydrogenase
MHPDDMRAVGVGEGDSVRITTTHDGIVAVAEGDDTLRRGVVAIAHAFGGLVEEDGRYAELGANTGRLVRTDEDYDPISGMPRMGNIPVAIAPHL